MIEVKNLSKKYGIYEAVKNINFTVSNCEILGFLGPNGAGKTTAMNMMTGYTAPTEGEVFIAGHSILEEAEKAKKHIGYLPDTPPVYGEMRVDEYLKFVADIKKVNETEKEKMILDIKEKVKISDISKRLIKNLSKGYKQRVGLAQALIGYPEILILDEPMTGLDPKQIIEMRDLIRELGKEHSIILSSHILSEIGVICDRVMIINKGEIVAIDTPEKLTQSFIEGGKMLVRFKTTEEIVVDIFKKNEEITNVVFKGIKEENTVDLVLEGDSDIREEIFNTAVENNITILMMKSLSLSLEDIFLQVTEIKDENSEEGSEENGSNL